MRTKSVALETQLSLREAGHVVTAAFATMKAYVEAIEAAPDPLDQLDGVADVAVVGRRCTVMDVWTVQVYLFELGSTCGVELVAVGESGLVRAVRGARTTASFARSVRRMDALVTELRARDPRAQVIS